MALKVHSTQVLKNNATFETDYSHSASCGGHCLGCCFDTISGTGNACCLLAEGNISAEPTVDQLNHT